MTTHDGQPLDEADLLGRAADGDRHALGVLLYAHYDRLLRRLERQVPADLRAVLSAEQVLQEAHLRAYRHLAQFRPRGRLGFFGWLARIADNALRDEVRRERRHKRAGGHPPAAAAGAQALLDSLAGPGSTPSHGAARREAANLLHQALDLLRPRQREAIRQVYLEGVPVADVARQMGISDSAVRALLDRGRDALRELLGSASQFFSRP